MAKLLDLATELVLITASYIPRSADKFHLALVNRRMQDVITPQLYKHIVLDQKGDPSQRSDTTRIRGGSC